MRTIYCLVCVLLVTINASTQKVSLTTKGPYELNIWNSRIIPFEKGFVSIETEGQDYKVERPVKIHFTFKIYDHDMTLLREILYTEDKSAIRPRDAKLIQIHKRIWFIYYEKYYKKGVGGNIMAIEINPEKLSIEKPKIIFDAEALNKKGAESILDLKIKSSPDEKKTAFIIDFGGSERTLIVTDENLDLIWTKKDFIADQNSRVLALAMSNQGQVFVGFSSNKVKNLSGNQLAVIDKTNTTFIDPFREMRYTYSYEFLQTMDEKTLHLIGNYSDLGTNNMTGFFHSTINIADLSILNKTKNPLPQELLLKLKDEGWATKTKKNPGINYPTTYFFAYNRFKPKLVELTDGSIIITFRLQEVVTSLDYKTNHKWIGPIVIGIIKDNNMKFTRLPAATNHSGTWEEVDDYTLIPYKDKVIIIYDDQLDNLQKNVNDNHPTNYLPKGLRDQNLALIYAILEKDGSIKRYQLSPENYFGITQFAVTVDSTLRLILNSIEKDYKIKLMGSLVIE